VSTPPAPAGPRMGTTAMAATQHAEFGCGRELCNGDHHRRSKIRIVRQIVSGGALLGHGWGVGGLGALAPRPVSHHFPSLTLTCQRQADLSDTRGQECTAVCRGSPLGVLQCRPENTPGTLGTTPRYPGGHHQGAWDSPQGTIGGLQGTRAGSWVKAPHGPWPFPWPIQDQGRGHRGHSRRRK